MPIQLYLAGKQKMKLHMYLHEWSTLTSSMRCHFCPWTASNFFFVIKIIFIHKSMHTIRIQYLNQKIHWTLILNRIWPTQRLHCVRLSLAKMLLVKMATAGSIESGINSDMTFRLKKNLHRLNYNKNLLYTCNIECEINQIGWNMWNIWILVTYDICCYNNDLVVKYKNTHFYSGDRIGRLFFVWSIFFHCTSTLLLFWSLFFVAFCNLILLFS